MPYILIVAFVVFLTSSNHKYFTSPVLNPSAYMRWIKRASAVFPFDVKTFQASSIISSTDSEFSNLGAFFSLENSIVGKLFLEMPNEVYQILFHCFHFLISVSFVSSCFKFFFYKKRFEHLKIKLSVFFIVFLSCNNKTLHCLKT